MQASSQASSEQRPDRQTDPFHPFPQASPAYRHRASYPLRHIAPDRAPLLPHSNSDWHSMSWDERTHSRLKRRERDTRARCPLPPAFSEGCAARLPTPPAPHQSDRQWPESEGSSPSPSSLSPRCMREMKLPGPFSFVPPGPFFLVPAVPFPPAYKVPRPRADRLCPYPSKPSRIALLSIPPL